VKNLGGGGFTFEDNVGAWLAAAMLVGAPPLDPELGAPIRIDFQVDVDGWCLDDVLITFTTARCCGSIKSFPQVANGRASADFVRRAWQDILGISEAGLDPDADRVVMIMAPLDITARRDLQELIRLARAQDPADLAARIAVDGYVSESKKTLFDSFAQPAGLLVPDTATIESSAAEVLSRLRLIEADFEDSPSRAHEHALGWCRGALVEEAQVLAMWEALLEIVAEHRPAGGRITRALLVSRVSERFDLRDDPIYAQDWTTRRAMSAANLDQIPDQLAGELHLDRAGLRTELETAAAGPRLIAVVGPSGCGKSALVRGWASTPSSSEILLLEARQLAALARPGGGLRHPLLETLDAARRPTWLVIDGLDRAFSDEADAAVAHLARAVAADPMSPVGLVITSQQQEWAALGGRLAARNTIVDWKLVVAANFSDEELGEVLRVYPELRDVAYRGRLTGALQNPKVLDTIQRALVAGNVDETTPLTGEESFFAKWFYDRLAVGTGRNRAARGALTLRLAELQGDRLQPETPLTYLDSAGLEHLDELERDGICAQVDGRVRFAHDLYGDWIRRCQILAHSADRRDYIHARLTSPLWHRAIRLHALSLLDSGDPSAWREEMTRLGGDELGLLHDLFLEALLFAADPVPTVDATWPALVASDGLLLGRLLVRFLHIATVPHPGIVDAVGEVAEDLATQVAATQRLPYWPLWIPLMQALSAHSDEALAIAGDEVARITDLWLRWTPDGFPLRPQAAVLAIARGQQVLAARQSGERVDDAVAARAWRAVLACAHERPQDIAEIGAALTPSGYETRPEGEADSHPRRSRRPRIDQSFRETCLDGDALHPMIVAALELAADLLFSVLEPRPPVGGWGLPGDELGIGRLAGWFVPLYTRGPFLAFLRTAPTEAVQFTVRLIEAATDRWVEAHGDDGNIELTVTLANQTTVQVRGNEQTMHWYRGDSQVPSPIACVLMALEKWLYDEIDAERNVDSTVAELLATTTSTAMIGLLIAVGCRHPTLLREPLRPLLGVPELYVWDNRYKLHEPRHLLIGLFQEHAEFRRLAEEWFLLDHRRIRLEQRATELLLTDAGTASYISQQLPTWRNRLDEDGEPAALRFLSARLDCTYWKERRDANGQQYWEFEPPNDLAAESKSTQEEFAQRGFWLTFPSQCRRILDGDLQLGADRLESFWEDATARVSEPAPDDILSGGVITADDAACGLAAVMLVQNREWIGRNPDRERLCVDLLLDAVATERDRQWFDSAEGGTDWSWDAFAAEAVPILWAEQPQEDLLRAAIGRLAFSLSYATIRRLFASCAQHRDLLGEDFGRLQHLAVHIALFRRAFEVARGRSGAQPPDRYAMKRHIDEFLDASLDPVPPAWASLAAPPARSPQTWSEIDTGYIQAAYAWMPPLDDARNARERAAWITHWEQSVIELVERLSRNIDVDDGEVDGTPGEDEYQLIRALAGRIIEMTADEARGIWQPLFDLGAAAYLWLDSVLTSWFLAGLQTFPVPESFVATWEEILDYIESAPAWSPDPPTLHSHELKQHALGLNALVGDLWQEEHAPIVSRFTERYERSRRPGLVLRDDAAVFARFLRRPAATPLLALGLAWLADADTPPAGYHRDNGYEDAVGALLDLSAERR
jgi:hypothetical protein